MSTEDEELQGEGSGREELQGNVNVASKQPCTFKLFGDNIDKSVKRRYMRADKGNLSLHYFHSYAVLTLEVSHDIPPQIGQIHTRQDISKPPSRSVK